MSSEALERAQDARQALNEEREVFARIYVPEHSTLAALRAGIGALDALLAEVARLEQERAMWENLAAKGKEWTTAAEADLAAARAREQRLAEYVLYTPCPLCRLPDPTRVGADCEQCALARAALAAEPAADEPGEQ